MHPRYALEARYRHPNEPAAPPSFSALAVAAAVPPAIVWALAHPAATLLALALAALALVGAAVWRRRVAGAQGRPRPAGQPD